MLQEIQVNALSGRGGASAGSGKVQDPRNGTGNIAVRMASAVRLPSSDDELEDFSSDSCSDDEDRPPVRPTPRRRLVRLDQSGNAAKFQPDDDLLDGIASLGIGSAGPRTAPGGAGIRTTAIQPAAGSAAVSEDESSESASDADSLNDKDDCSDGDDAPFYERQAPPVTATAAAAGISAPEPGALVLGEQQQYVLAPAVAQKLYPHQVTGVTWLWNLFAMQRGGILGDDMGLGKTMQCSAFLAGLFTSQLVRRAIIIAPKTLIPHWIKELGVCGLRNITCEFSGSESERSAALRRTVGGRGIIVTTYGMVQHNSEQLARPASSRADRAFTWDVMFLDEGHKIKNPKMKLVEHLRKLPARVRVIISGTPIQNNLMDMHSLFDFCTYGLLGDAKTFRKNYERPITKGLDKEATAREGQTSAAIAAELRQRVEPFFLRREKKDVLTGASTSSSSAAGDAPQIGQRARGLPRKNDLVVWVRLTPLQRKIYTAFLHTDGVRQVLNEKASPLAAITVLKKICDHPALLTERAASSVISGAHRWANHGGRRRRDTDDFIVYSDEEDESDDGDSNGSDSADKRSPASGSGADEMPAEWLGDAAALDSELSRELEQRGAAASCKSAFVLALLKRLHAEGHRTLIFSQSKVMLSILEAGVKEMQLSYCRIDGDISSADERQAHVQRFQTSNIPVFLLTSQVGGLGLTLTGADRVIIVDPAWNPSVDDQSVDRAYRMGQTRDVVVYRLITCGTVEEKIYRRQVYKGGLSKTGTEEGIQFRYFTQTELRDLFAVTAEGLQQSGTQLQLHKMHAHQRDTSEEVRQHLEQVLRMDSVAGIHDHNLMFSQRPEEPVPTAQEGAAILSQMTGCGLVGVDALTNMLGKGLQLGGRAEDIKRQAAVQTLRDEIADLTNRIHSTQVSISGAKCDKLPDRGAKMKESLREMLAKREVLALKLPALESRTTGSETPDPDTGVGLAAAQVRTVSATTTSGGSADATLWKPQPKPPATSTGGSADANLRKLQPQAPATSSGGSAGTEQQPLGKIGGRTFGAGLRSRSTAGGGRDSTDSVNVSGAATLPSQKRATPSHEQSLRSAEQGYSNGAPAINVLDTEEASFITASSTGTPGGAVEDDANSGCVLRPNRGDVRPSRLSPPIDLTDTP